jgi:hypothetical protein
MYSLAIGRSVELKLPGRGEEYRYSSAASSLVELKLPWRGEEYRYSLAIGRSVELKLPWRGRELKLVSRIDGQTQVGQHRRLTPQVACTQAKEYKL